ncbi:rap guanine nucleotide exchange factor 2 [Trichonephila clavipes]|nr:rap guanine nucleotide exchange factor 2 [Trichonephila clavipes]
MVFGGVSVLPENKNMMDCVLMELKSDKRFQSFGKRSGGSGRRVNECLILEPSEMIVDVQGSSAKTKSSLKGMRQPLQVFSGGFLPRITDFPCGVRSFSDGRNVRCGLIGQVTRTTPELKPLLQTTLPRQLEHFQLNRFNVHQSPLHGRSSVAPGLEPKVRQKHASLKFGPLSPSYRSH